MRMPSHASHGDGPGRSESSVAAGAVNGSPLRDVVAFATSCGVPASEKPRAAPLAILLALARRRSIVAFVRSCYAASALHARLRGVFPSVSLSYCWFSILNQPAGRRREAGGGAGGGPVGGGFVPGARHLGLSRPVAVRPTWSTPSAALATSDGDGLVDWATHSQLVAR